jgi:protein-S-isoprenylcysteine O-methyltransferase Ste14
MKANIATLAVLAVVVVLFLLHVSALEWTPLRVVGAVIAGAALTGLVVARVQLGAAFSVTAKAKKLVTTGVYARIRNPIYVFGGLFLVGAAMLLGNWVLLVIVVALIPLQIVRARKEAQVLEEAFGEEYLRYKAQSWF